MRAVLDRPAASRRGGEKLVDLEQAFLDPDDLGRLLVHEVLAKAILPVHLEHEAAEIADTLLP